MIGTTARTLLVGGGGSSRVLGVQQREISPLDALRQRAGAGGHVTFRVGRDLQGVAVPSSALAPPNAAPGQHGLLRTNTVTGATQIDPNLDFVGSRALPEGTQATWTGTVTAPTTGDYLLAVQTAGTGGSLHRRRSAGRQRWRPGAARHHAAPDHRRPGELLRALST